MKQKLFTLLTLLVLCVTGAWANQTTLISGVTLPDIPSATLDMASQTDFTPDANGWIVFGPSSSQDNVVAKSYWNGTANTTSASWSKPGSAVAPFKGGSSINILTVQQTDRTHAFRFTGAESASFLVSSGGSRTIYVALYSYDGETQTQVTGSPKSIGNSVTELLYSGLSTSTNYIAYFYESTNSNGRIFEIALKKPVGAQAPVFSPATGSSVAAGSKITITSANSTSIKYKWTDSSTTPDGGWSTYDAEAKVTVPAYGSSTTYLHAQGFKDEEAGTAAYAQYTITAPDTEAPTLSSTSPVASATDVTVSGNIVLTFNENVVCTTNATLTPEGGDAINLTPVVSGTTLTYTYENLAYNKSHTFNLAANSVADGSGNKYASAINFSFTTIQETVANPVITIYGSKVVNITCATAGDVKIYYGGSDVKSGGSKTLYEGNFIPASNGTIYAYATKEGAIASDVTSQSVTLPAVGDVVGNKLMTLQPEATPGSDTAYGSNTFTKAGYTLASDKVLNNSAMAGYPCNFKATVNTATFTITPPSNVTIKSIKIYGTSNDNSKETAVTAGDGGTIITTPSSLMVRNILIDGNVVMSEVVMTVDTPTEGAAVSFKLGGTASQARFYVEVYGTTSATAATINVAKEYTTYIPTYDLDFSSAAELTAYIATAATASTVTMEPINKVPAGTPIVLKSTSLGADIDVSVAASTDDVSTNKLKIGDGATSIGGDGKWDYILSNGKFYHASAGVLPAGKCYLHLDAAPEANELTMDFGEGDVTAINKVEAAKQNVGEFYNLAGQRVAQPTKGLYITNGKKVIVK